MLFHAVARVAPAEAYAVVGARLQRALADPGASSQARQGSVQSSKFGFEYGLRWWYLTLGVCRGP